MIGNVKSGSKMFPKDFLIKQVPHREDRFTCVAQTRTRGGITIDLLAAADMDKQPMALCGTAGTSSDGKNSIRKFSTIRPNGTYSVREASLKQMQIHEVYRKHFNALDKHNAIRQGGACLETSWKTKRWYIRDFQALFGMSMVNAFLFYRRYSKLPGASKMSYTLFQRKLCYQMLRHPRLIAERNVARARRGDLPEGAGVVGHECLKIGTHVKSGGPIKRACIFCGERTELYCACTPLSGKKGIYVCSTGIRPQCLAKHLAGDQPVNRKMVAAPKKWERKRRDAHRHDEIARNQRPRHDSMGSRP